MRLTGTAFHPRSSPICHPYTALLLNSPICTIDPEDLQAHYNLMLCYNGLGQKDRAEEHQKRYLRFKADESAQAITGPYRINHPEDNNERQAIHEHVSAPFK